MPVCDPIRIGRTWISTGSIECARRTVGYKEAALTSGHEARKFVEFPVVGMDPE
jgi:hypothetical protein